MGFSSSTDDARCPGRLQEVVVEFGHRALESDDLDRVLTDAVGTVADTLDAELCAIFDRAPGDDDYRISSGVGWDDGVLGRPVASTAIPADGGSVLPERSRRVENPSTDGDAFAGALLADHDVHSGLLVRIGSEEAPWGVFGVFSREERSFPDPVVTFLEGVCTVVASAAETERVSEKMARIYGRIPDAYVAVDEDWRLTDANATAEDMFEPEQGAFLGQRLWDVLPERLVEAFREPFERAMADRETASVEAYYPDPVDRWFEVDAHPSETGLSIYLRDVTERTEFQRRLTTTERRYRTLVEHFPEGIVALFDEDFRYTAAGGELFDKVETTPEEPVGSTIYDRYPPDVIEEIEPHFAAALAGTTSSFEIFRDGRHLRVQTLPVHDDDNEASTGMLVIQDVTERMNYQQRLEERISQQEAVTDLGQQALETDDLDQLLHDAAALVAETLDVEYCKVLELLPSGDRMLLRQGVGWQEGLVGEGTVPTDDDSQAGHTLESREPIVVEDLATESRFSGPALLLDHDVTSGVSVIIGSVDEPWGVLGVHTTDQRAFTQYDVNFVQSVSNLLAGAIERHAYETELQTTIDRLSESNERLEQFAYAASHDLQEPLRMVSSYLQLIERRYGDEFDEDGEEFFEFAIDGAERMRDMINGLLKYSRVETEGSTLEPVDLDEVLADVRDDLQLRMEETGATLEVESLPCVMGDPRQLRQVLQNLLDNAFEYSGEEPPHVTITAQQAGRRVRISVADEGVGIPPEHTDRVFEVFQSLHGPDEHDGTGIGLALCERIVERHDGEIWVDSEPGAGATFTFTLPAVEGSR